MISFRDAGAMRESYRIVGSTPSYGMRAASSPRVRCWTVIPACCATLELGGCSVMSQLYTTQHR
jgi:hypothetical protein